MEINLRNIIRGGLTLLFLVTFNILHYHSVDGLTKLGKLRASGAIATSPKTYDSPSRVPQALPEITPQSRPVRRNLSQSESFSEAEKAVDGSHFIRTGFSRRESPIIFTPENSKKDSGLSEKAIQSEKTTAEQPRTGKPPAFSQRQKREIEEVTPFPFNLRAPRWFSSGKKGENVEDTEVWSPGIQPHRLTPVTLAEDGLLENGENSEVSPLPEVLVNRSKPVIHPIFPPVGASTPDFSVPAVPDERFMEASPVKPLRLDIQFQQSTKTLPELPERPADAHAGKWEEWRECSEDAEAELGQMPAFADMDLPDSAAAARTDDWPGERNLISDGVFLRPETEMYVREEVYMPTSGHFGVRKPILPEDESDFPAEFYPNLQNFPPVQEEEAVADLTLFPKVIQNFPPLEEEITELPF